MLNTLLLAATALGLTLAAPAYATAVYVLDQSNTAGVGTGPYAEATVTLTSPTTATIDFTRLDGFSITDVGANVNASTFTVGSVTAKPLPGGNTPTFTPCINCSGGQGQLDGFGNLTLVENAVPSGFSAGLIEVSFTVTNTSGTWASDLAVLTPNVKGNDVAAHTFTSTGNSFYSAGNTGCDIGPGCNPPPPPPGVPEPSTLAVLGMGLLGLGAAKRRYSR